VARDHRLVRDHRGALGAWFLQVEGYNTRARVKRIK
jgi:hypothetical protein